LYFPQGQRSVAGVKCDRTCSRPAKHWNILHKVLIALTLVIAASGQTGVQAADLRGRQFIGLDSFSNFAQTPGSLPDQTVLTSPVIPTGIPFNEVIVSWNADLPQDSYLIIEARVAYPETNNTRYYNLGFWSKNPALHPRQSQKGQKDADGDVSTDTLILYRPASGLQVRLTLGAAGSAPNSILKFVGISLTDTNTAPEPLPPRRETWGKLIPVTERTQMIYPNGKTLCSPTTVSMLMSHWAEALKRPELDRTVPEIVEAIYDSQWQGTGNWPFNMAYAGSFPGMRAYVARLSDVSELENWIDRAMPVGLSLDYDRLRGKGPGPNGHLVVLVGFTKEGDPIINDPGTSQHVRKTFPRKNLIDAWACSRNTVYLIYPENATTPEDAFGHWDSPVTRRWSALPR
jgi:hypothetical protein